MSQAEAFGGPWAWLVAASYAIFVTGITWISRSEVHSGLKKNIAVGLAFQGLAIAGFLLACGQSGSFPLPERASIGRVLIGLVVLATLGFVVLSRSYEAYRKAEPADIQRAVKSSIMALVWLHVGLLLGVRGVLAAFAMALFWVPAAYLGRWIYST